MWPTDLSPPLLFFLLIIFLPFVSSSPPPFHNPPPQLFSFSHVYLNYHLVGLGRKKTLWLILLSSQPNAQLVKRVNGFEKYKKWAKLDPCFSFNKPTKQEILHFLGWSRPKFCTKTFSPHCWKESFAKIMANVQKMLKGASAEADFWHGKNIEHAEKKSSK